LNNLGKVILKSSIVILIFIYIWDKLDINQFKKFIDSPGIFLLLIFSWIINILLTIFRLFIILISIGRKVSFISLVKSCISSMFVGNLLPGVVGADAVKFLYIKKLDPEIGKTKLALILFMDRLLGLIGVLFWCSIGGLTLLIFYRNNISTSLHFILYLPSILLPFTLLALFSVYVYFRKFPYTKFNGRFDTVFMELSAIITSCNLRHFLMVMGANLLAILLLLLALVYMGIFITSSPNIEGGMIQFFLIPLVLFSSMIPLAPLGIGLAQLTMAGAYELFGLSPSTGIAVSTASQMALLLVTLIVGGTLFMVNSNSKSDRINK
jgi:uncharacterized membrane protein YbhN (UPF0104 family)